MFNISKLEGQVSHEYGLKRGRSRDERWGIPKRRDVQAYTPQQRKPQTLLWKGQFALVYGEAHKKLNIHKCHMYLFPLSMVHTCFYLPFNQGSSHLIQPNAGMSMAVANSVPSVVLTALYLCMRVQGTSHRFLS